MYRWGDGEPNQGNILDGRQYFQCLATGSSGGPETETTCVMPPDLAMYRWGDRGSSLGNTVAGPRHRSVPTRPWNSAKPVSAVDERECVH